MPIEVTVTEFRLLEAMIQRPGIVFSRTRLLEILRGDDTVVAERIIDTYVRRLRRKMEAIDPAFDQLYADATHIKLVEGESLADLAPLLDVLGRMSARIVAVGTK